MRRFQTFLLSFAVLITGVGVAQAALPKAGATCPKAGMTALNANVKFTCIKSGKKTVWNQGVTLSSPVTNKGGSGGGIVPTPTPSPTAPVVPVVQVNPGPVIKPGSVKLSNTSVTVDPQQGTSAQVNVSFAITDTQPCCSIVTLVLVDPNGKAQATTNLTPISGTPNDASYQGYFTLSSNAMAGNWSAQVTAQDFKGLAISNINLSDISVAVAAPKAPSVSNLSAVWSNTTLNLNFDLDLSLPANFLVTQYEVTITLNDGTSSNYQYMEPVRSPLHHTIPFTLQQNAALFGFLQSTTIKSVSVAPVFGVGAVSIPAKADVPQYQSSLPAPIITVTPMTNGYTVAWDSGNSTPHMVSIQEYKTSSQTTPDGAIFNGVASGSTNPVSVFVSDTSPRLVRVVFYDALGVASSPSNVVSVTPLSVAVVNVAGPAPIAEVTSYWSTNGMSDPVGNTILMKFNAPANSSRFQVTLTAPNGKSGVFYFNSNGATAQALLLSQNDIFAQFGAYYSQYSGSIIALSPIGNASTATSFVVPLRGNPLAGITP